MRHGEIALGVEYACSLRGRLPLGHPEMKRVVVLDPEKTYAFGPNRTVVDAWRLGSGAMKIEIRNDDGTAREWCAMPADLICTWTEHQAQVKENEKRRREAERSKARQQREKKAMTKRLNRSGFDVVANYGGDRWYVPTEILVQLLDAYEGKK